MNNLKSVNKYIDLTLNNMLSVEDNYIISGNYFNRVGCTSVTESMRSKLATWMLEVCEEEKCTDQVYSLSMNIFDRLMCVLDSIEVYQLQLLGCVCLFIASKLQSINTTKLTACKLVEYTDNSIRLDELIEWELFVLDKLRWDIACILPNDYIDLFTHLIQFDLDLDVLRRHCYAFTALCSTDFKFSHYPASLIASACLLMAFKGLTTNEDSTKTTTSGFLLELLSNQLSQLTNIDYECLMSVREQVDDLFKQSSSSSTSSSTSSSSVSTTNGVQETKIYTVNTSEINYEDDYDFDLDYNLNLNSNNQITDDYLFDSSSYDSQLGYDLMDLSNVYKPITTPKLDTIDYLTTKFDKELKELTAPTTTTTQTMTTSATKTTKGKSSRKSTRKTTSSKRLVSMNSVVENCLISPPRQQRLPQTTNSPTNSSRSSSGVSSTSGFVYLNRNYCSNASSRNFMPSMMITPPSANSLPMPTFNMDTNNDNSQIVEIKSKTTSKRSSRSRRTKASNKNPNSNRFLVVSS